jgi:Tfp pilus assembly protein PilN
MSLCLVFGFYLYQVHVVLDKKCSLTTLENLHTHLGVRIEAIKRVQGELERLDQQQSFLESITRNQSYSEMLLMLADILNEETWLRQLAIHKGEGSAEEEEDVTSLELTGFSFSNEKLGDFINQLSLKPIFREVVLKYARETIMPALYKNAGESIRVIEFQIACNLGGG